ncbi:MAG: sigma-70 family RNA polymerase sigma factor [Candidatus Paceibacterota bacterium]
MSKDKKLVKKAQKGDSNAFGKLYDKYIDRIYRYIFIRVSNKTEAEDVTQQVFLKAWKNINRYETQKNTPFSSWLYTIAKNSIIDYYRKDRDHLDIDFVSDKISTSEKHQEEKTDTELRIELVKNQLNRLSEDEQDVLIMRFIDEMSNKEVAKITGKTSGAVRVMQHRALKKLKKQIKKQYHDG